MPSPDGSPSTSMHPVRRAAAAARLRCTPFVSLYSLSFYVLLLLSIASPAVHCQETASSSASSSASSASPDQTNTTRPLGTRAHHGLPEDGMQAS